MIQNESHISSVTSNVKGNETYYLTGRVSKEQFFPSKVVIMQKNTIKPLIVVSGLTMF